MKICVLKGGTSPERDISLKSGEAVARALRKKGFSVEELDIKTESFSWLEKHIPLDCDVFFIALHGGRGEGGEVQKFLEDKGLVFTGSSSKASFNAMNKAVSRRLFAGRGLRQMHWCMFTKLEEVFFPEFNLPFIIKPVDAGSSVGISIVDEPDDFMVGVYNAFRVSNAIIVEEFVKGRELTVGILGSRVLEPIEIRPRESRVFDFNSKYTKGKTDYLIPVSISEELKAQVKLISLEAFEALGCKGFGRVDLILADDSAYVLEVNTIPGMTELSLLPMAAAYEGICFADLCEYIIDLARN